MESIKSLEQAIRILEAAKDLPEREIWIAMGFTLGLQAKGVEKNDEVIKAS